jgi:hypothetical protein
VPTSRVPAALDALVAALEAVLDPGIVYDGPELTGDTPPVAVCVGYDGDPEGDMRAVENWAQTFVGLGAQRREESFDILGCVVAFSGDTTVKDKRDAVFATFGTAETALRAAANQALGLGAPAQAEFTSGEFYQEQTTQGLQSRIPWTISVSHVRI